MSVYVVFVFKQDPNRQDSRLSFKINNDTYLRKQFIKNDIYLNKILKNKKRINKYKKSHDRLSKFYFKKFE